MLNIFTFLFLFVSEDQAALAVRQTVQHMYFKLEQIDKRLVGNEKIERIKDQIQKAKEGSISSFLVKSAEIYNAINSLATKNNSYKDNLFGDIVFENKIPEEDSNRSVLKEFTESAAKSIAREFININNPRVALFPFASRVPQNNTDVLKSYQLPMFYNALKLALRNQKVLVLSGEDLTDACISAGVDLQNVTIEKLDGIIRFLKATKIDFAVFGTFSENSMLAYVVNSSGDFKLIDSITKIDSIIQRIPQPIQNDFSVSAGNGFNKSKVKIYFEYLLNDQWERIDVVGDKKAAFGKDMLYLALPDAAVEQNAKFRIKIYNKGLEPENIIKTSRLGRVVGVDVTIDGISAFLDEGKGVPSIPGQGRKLLMSPPGYEVDFAAKGAVRTGKDNSELKVSGFLDDRLNEEKQFYFGSVDDAFALQFLGTNKKPIGLITIDLFMQKLQGDQYPKMTTKGPGGAGIMAGDGKPVIIKDGPKFDYYNDQKISNTFSYRKKTDLKKLIPENDWLYYRD